MTKEKILSVTDLTQQFQSGNKLLTVLDSINFEVEQGDTCSIVGPSGSGKTTLLGLCTGLDRPTRGEVTLNGVRLGPLDEDERAEVRNDYVGFVFQTFQLIPTLTALENVMVPMELRGQNGHDIKKDASRLLDQVGLGDRLHHYPTQLSGGEQQRVAIARAFINKPNILFADEPTGNLDAGTSHTIEELLFDLNEASGTTLIVVTHDLELANMCNRVIHLKNGKVDRDERIDESQLVDQNADGS